MGGLWARHGIAETERKLDVDGENTSKFLVNADDMAIGIIEFSCPNRHSPSTRQFEKKNRARKTVYSKGWEIDGRRTR